MKLTFCDLWDDLNSRGAIPDDRNPFAFQVIRLVVIRGMKQFALEFVKAFNVRPLPVAICFEL